MASRVKKLFHRNKNDSPQQPEEATPSSPPRKRLTARVVNSNPALRQSQYEDARRGPAPDAGSYPMRGNGSTSLDMSRRRASMHNRDSQPPRVELSYPSSYTHQGDDLMSTNHPVNASVAGMAESQPHDAPQTNRSREGRVTGENLPGRSQADLSQDFDNLNLGRQNATIPWKQPRAPLHAPGGFSHAPHREDIASNNGYSQPRADPRRYQPQQSSDAYSEEPLQRSSRDPLENYVPEKSQPAIGYGQGTPEGRAGALRSEDRLSAEKAHTGYSAAPGYDSAYYPSDAEDSALRRTSIQRKQVGSSPVLPYEPPATQIGAQKRLPTVPHESSTIRQVPSNQSANIYSSKAMGQPTNSSGVVGGRTAPEDVVSRAKGNTYDTEVVEKIAPAVVHETVNQDVHHVREEVITRDIHTKDVYHRILPVVDVEVLPPRHFLPVEGGGLVEVSAEDVPGRGRNWVIAETASKIASDEAAPRTTDRFSAREFLGTEGDSKEYVKSDGTRTTEETWVHPPELETGGRDTGQTWPMEFGTRDKKHHGPSNKSPKKPRSAMKHPNRPSGERSYAGGEHVPSARA